MKFRIEWASMIAVIISGSAFYGFMNPDLCYSLLFDEDFNWYEKYLLLTDAIDKTVNDDKYYTKQFTEEVLRFCTNASFLKRDVFSKLMDSVSYDQCQLCKIAKSNSNSNKRDIIISTVYGRHGFNILTFLRSLRSTGSKCTVVIFYTNEFMNGLNEQVLEESKKCGAVWINIGDDTHARVHIISGRFVIYRAFLYQYQDLFNRVIFTDLFDTFFQQDPFGPRFNAHYFRPTLEGLIIHTEVNNRGWMKHIDRNYDQHATFFSSAYVINAGFLYGGIDHAIRFFHYYINLTYWFKDTPNDQGLLNYQYYIQNLYDGSFKIDTDVDNLISTNGWQFERYPREDGLMYTNFRDIHKAPTGMHEYNRYCPLNEYIKERCPVLGNFDADPYGRRTNLFQRC